VVRLVVVVQEEEVVAVGSEFNACDSAVKVASGFTLVRMFSLSNGVVRVGDDEAEVVTEAVVMPISVVVTMVSMSGDESVVWACVGAVDDVIDPPPVDNFFSMLLFSAGAELPPRHGKQQRNSVEWNFAPQVHDSSSRFCPWRSTVLCAMLL
jgi:hypothetical protein